MKKRILSIMLVLALVCSMAPLSSIESKAEGPISIFGEPEAKYDMSAGDVNSVMDLSMKKDDLKYYTITNTSSKKIVLKVAAYITSTVGVSVSTSAAPAMMASTPSTSTEEVAMWKYNSPASNIRSDLSIEVEPGEEATFYIGTPDSWISAANIMIDLAFNAEEYVEVVPTQTPAPTAEPTAKPTPGYGDPTAEPTPGYNTPTEKPTENPAGSDEKCTGVASVVTKESTLSSITLSISMENDYSSSYSGVEVYRNGKKIATVTIPYYASSEDYADRGLKPNTSYTYKCVPYYVSNGKTIYGAAKTTTAKTATVKKVVGLKVTKLASNVASVTFRAPIVYTSKDAVFKIYAGKKVVKTVKASGKFYYVNQIKGKKAGSKSYKVVTIAKANSKLKASTGAKKPAKNARVAKWSYSTSPAQYPTMKEIWRPSKISCNGSGVNVKGFFINSHILSLSQIVYKISVYYNGVDGKRVLIGTKTIKSGKMSMKSKKNTSFKLKTKKLLDHKNGSTLYVAWEEVSFKY